MPHSQQSFEFIESVNDALGAAVRALGGAKKVGVLLKPEKPVEEAKNWVNDCLNGHREVFFHPEQVQLILREARKAGFHESINFICGDAGYAAPQPVEPEDEKAQLMRDFIASIAQQTLNIKKLEALGGVTLKSVA